MRIFFLVVVVVVVYVFGIEIVSCEQWVGKNLTQPQLGQIKEPENGVLDISGNDIETISTDEFKGIQRLETLTMNENRNFQFTPNVRFLSRNDLESFNCKTCGVTRIYGQTFEGLPSLKTINLSGNQLKTVENGAFKSNPNLTMINLSSNKLTVINPELFKPTSLLLLYLQFNSGLKFTSGKVLECPKLTSLNLQNASFTEITVQTFKGLPKLIGLNLIGNSISRVENGSFDSNKNLEVLLLNNNTLRVMDLEVVSSLKNLSKFCVDGNPFDRDPRNVRLQSNYSGAGFQKSCDDKLQKEAQFENLDLEPLPVVRNETHRVDTEEEPQPNQNIGISDAFIGSYITIIVIIQSVAIVLLVWYLVILLKPVDLAGQIDYSSTILNDNDIYAVDRCR